MTKEMGASFRTATPEARPTQASSRMYHRVFFQKHFTTAPLVGKVADAYLSFESYERVEQFVKRNGTLVAGQEGHADYRLVIRAITSAEPGSQGPCPLAPSKARPRRTADRILRPHGLQLAVVVTEIPPCYKFLRKGEHNGRQHWLFYSVVYQNYILAVEETGTFLAVIAKPKPAPAQRPNEATLAAA